MATKEVKSLTQEKSSSAGKSTIVFPVAYQVVVDTDRWQERFGKHPDGKGLHAEEVWGYCRQQLERSIAAGAGAIVRVDGLPPEVGPR